MKNSPTRYRWFNLRPFDSKMLRMLSDGMLKTKFNDDTSFGFIIGDVRKDTVTGRYVQKETITRTITNALGESENVQFTDFTSTKFIVSTTQPNLEVVNSPRRLSEFLTAIGDLLDNKIAIVPIEVTCRIWLDSLSKADCKICLTKIVTNNYPISDTVSVKATFTGTRNVQKEAQSFLNGKPCEAVEIAGEVEYDGNTAKVRITSTGVFTFQSPPPEALLAAVRSCCDIASKRS